MDATPKTVLLNPFIMTCLCKKFVFFF